MKNRGFFALWIVMLAVLWLMGKLASAGILLADSMLAAVVLSVQAGIAARHLKTDCSLRGSQNGEKQARLQIDTNYKGLLPVKLCLQLRTENRLTGETAELRAEGVLAGRGPGQNQLQLLLEEKHAGKLQITVESLQVTDLFGLIPFRLQDKKQSREPGRTLSCLLLPESVKPPQLPEAVRQYDQNSDVYAEDRPGPDLSQTYELREYHSGDSLRSIHWKRSSRGDSWIVREGSWPVGQSLLLLLENSYPFAEPDRSAAETKRMREKEAPRDAIEQACARLIALSETLTDRGMPHCIGWWNSESQSVQTAEIRTAEDLIQTLGSVLSVTLEERNITIGERFSQSGGDRSFSQVMIIEDETAKNYNL